MEVPEPRGMISLTYDGLLPSHVEVAIPALDAAGLKGTFFGDGSGFAGDLRIWREVAERGHELGNGALIALADHFEQMTPEGLLEEIRETDELLMELTGEPGPFSLAWPIGSPKLSDPNFNFAHPTIIRTGLDGFNQLGSLDYKRLRCSPGRDLSGEMLIDFGVSSSVNWLIYAFEGIGEGENGIDRNAHQQLLDWLIEQQSRVVTIAEGARVSKRAAEDV